SSETGSSLRQCRICHELHSNRDERRIWWLRVQVSRLFTSNQPVTKSLTSIHDRFTKQYLLEAKAVKLKRLGWMLLCILSAVSLSLGQTATTSLRGTIKDPSGALVPGAKITITDKTVGTTFSAMADNGGNYVFAQIPPARYTITATAAGFGDQSKTA